MMVAPSDGGGAAAAVEQTEFKVVLTSFGDKKLDVVKVCQEHHRRFVDGCQEVGRRRSSHDQGRRLERRCREDQKELTEARRRRRAEVVF